MALFSKFFQSSNRRPLIQSSPTLHTESEWIPEDSDSGPSSTTTTKTPLTWHEALSLAFSPRDLGFANLERTSLSSVILTFSDGSKMQVRAPDGSPLELLLHGKNLILKVWPHGDVRDFVALPNGYFLHVKDKKVSFIPRSTSSDTTELPEMSASMGLKSQSVLSRSYWLLQLFLVTMFLILVVGVAALWSRLGN